MSRFRISNTDVTSIMRDGLGAAFFSRPVSGVNDAIQRASVANWVNTYGPLTTGLNLMAYGSAIESLPAFFEKTGGYFTAPIDGGSRVGLTGLEQITGIGKALAELSKTVRTATGCDGVRPAILQIP